jgi:AraC-like DNA-binding protein
VPSKERFDAWQADSSPLFDFSPPNDRTISYDASVEIARLGDTMFGRSIWLNPTHSVTQTISRGARKIRADGADHYFLCMRQGSATHALAGQPSIQASPGDLYLLDLAAQFDLQVVLSDALFLVVPRDVLPAHVANLHGAILRGGMGGLLADYVRGLARNLKGLRSADLPFAAQATRNMLLACLVPTADTLACASSELDAILVQRINRYIDKNLTLHGLNPDQICQENGISRTKLYQLFESSGGVMRCIQRKRLHRIRNILADPLAPKSRISDVAWRNGFADEKYFSRAFKVEFGHTPREALQSRQQREISRRRSDGTGAELNRETFSEWLSQSR